MNRLTLPQSALRAGSRPRVRGIALPITMIVILLVMTIGLSMIELSRMESFGAVRDRQSMEALAAAEYGLARAQAMARSQNCAWSVMTYDGAYLDFTMSTDADTAGHYVCELFSDEPVNVDGSEATYTVVIEDMTTWFPGNGSFKMHAFGRSGNHVEHITVNADSLTYAAFAWLTNSENNTYFASGDTIDGWVYTNDHLNIYGSPTFTGRVNSASSWINYYHGGPPYDNPDFQQGVELNSAKLDLSTLINDGHVNAVRNRALEPEGIWLGSNGGRPYVVDFVADGTVTIQKKNWDGSWTTVVSNKSLADTNGAIYVEDTCAVRGTVNGQATLATPRDKDILVIDDLVYASATTKAAPYQSGFDFDDESFNDKLGLIAGRDIVIRKNWTSDWSDMYVMASTLAVTGQFRNYFYQSYGFKTLHMLGGIAQNTRGPVGLTSGCGFLKDYRYDQRFFKDPPPHFPLIMYEYDMWTLSSEYAQP